MLARRPLAALAAAGLALLVASPVLACSQCLCGSPTPAGFLLGGPGSTLSYGLEDVYLSKSNALGEEPGKESQSEHRLSAYFAWRPSNRVLLLARAPYTFKSNTSSPSGSEGLTVRSHGMSDAELLARMDVLQTMGMFSRSGALALTSTLTLPTGSNEARDASGERLDAHLQPGSGALSWTGGVAVDQMAGKGVVSASLLVRVNGTNARGYHYGDAVLWNAGYARSMGGGWQAAAELNGRAAGFDRAEGGDEDLNTGGSLLYLAPSVRWSGEGPLALNLLAQFPVVRSLHGMQSEKGTLRMGLSFSPR